MLALYVSAAYATCPDIRSAAYPAEAEGTGEQAEVFSLTYSLNAPPTNITGVCTSMPFVPPSLAPSLAPSLPTATTVPTPSAPNGKSVNDLFRANACSPRHRNVSHPPFTPAYATLTMTSSDSREPTRSSTDSVVTFATSRNDAPARAATSFLYVAGNDKDAAPASLRADSLELIDQFA